MLCLDTPDPHDIQDSFKGRQDFDKSWLSGGKETTLRMMVGKVCNDARYDLKNEVCHSVGGERDGAAPNRP